MAVFLPKSVPLQSAPPSLYLHIAFALETQAWVLSAFLDIQILPLALILPTVILATTPAAASVWADEAKHWFKRHTFRLQSMTEYYAALSSWCFSHSHIAPVLPRHELIKSWADILWLFKALQWFFPNPRTAAILIAGVLAVYVIRKATICRYDSYQFHLANTVGNAYYDRGYIFTNEVCGHPRQLHTGYLVPV